MTDRFGALALPVPVGGLAVRLSVLVAFCRAVLVSQAQAAFAAVAPLEPNEIVAAMFIEDPKRRSFVEQRELPALFAYEVKGQFDPDALGDGYNRSSSTIGLWWLFPPADKESRRSVDQIGGDLARVLAAACRDARHPAYVHPDDEADPDAIKLSFAAPAIDTVYSDTDFDGAIGAGNWPTPGRVLLTKSAGAWDTSLPVVVTVVLSDGTEHAEDVYFASATDAESVEAAWIGSSVVSVAVPGQTTTATLTIGRALNPACEHGSPVRVHMGVHRLALTTWERKDLAIDVRPGAPPQRFEGVYFEIAIEETRDRTGEALGYDELDAVGQAGMVISVDGGVSAEVSEV
jgi:hypothetical protein